MVDAGNALFKATGLDTAEDQRRAAFILKTMGQLGTVAMAPGARDLNAGPSWLKSHAEKAKVAVLSANLVDAENEPIFPASQVVEVGGKKIGLIGASPAGPVENGQGAKGLPIAPAVIAEARKLRPKTDLIVVLAAVPYSDAMRLSGDAGDQVDFIIQSHEGRGRGALQHGDGNFVMPGGERGRVLGKLTVDVSRKGPFVDAHEKERDAETLKILEGQVAEVKKRLTAAQDPAAKAQLQKTLQQFELRHKEVSKRLSSSRKAAGREVSLDWLTLSGDYASDPLLEAAVKQIEPNGAEH